MNVNIIKYLLVGAALLVGIIVTDYLFLPYLEKNNIWPPRSVVSVLIFILGVALIFSLLKMMSKFKEKFTKSNLILLACIVFIYPWVLRALDVLLEGMLHDR